MKRMVRTGLAFGMTLCLVVSSMAVPTELFAKTVLPKKITLNKKLVSLRVGKKFKIKVKKVTPKKASKKISAFQFKSSKKKVATVSKKGVIKAKKVGSCKVTVTSKKRKKVKATIKVKVTKKKAAVTTTPTSQPISPTAVPLPTNAVKPTEAPMPTAPGTNTAAPTPTEPGTNTAAPTPTEPGTNTAAPTPTAPGTNTAAPTPTAPGTNTAAPGTNTLAPKPTAPGTNTLAPKPTAPGTNTLAPKPTAPGTNTAAPTPTAPGTNTAAPTPTAPGANTAAPTPTAPGANTAAPTPTAPGTNTEAPTPTAPETYTEVEPTVKEEGGVKFNSYPLDSSKEYRITYKRADGTEEAVPVPASEISQLLSKMKDPAGTYSKWMSTERTEKEAGGMKVVLTTADEGQMDKKQMTISGSENSRFNGTFDVKLQKTSDAVYTMTMKKQTSAKENTFVTTDNSDSVIVSGSYNGSSYKAEAGKQKDTVKVCGSDGKQLAKLVKTAAGYDMDIDQKEAEQRGLVVSVKNQGGVTPTGKPTNSPSAQPGGKPTNSPTSTPSSQPGGKPTNSPTSTPSSQPGGKPTNSPSSQPTNVPTNSPTSAPTAEPEERTLDLANDFKVNGAASGENAVVKGEDGSLTITYVNIYTGSNISIPSDMRDLKYVELSVTSSQGGQEMAGGNQIVFRDADGKELQTLYEKGVITYIVPDDKTLGSIVINPQEASADKPQVMKIGYIRLKKVVSLDLHDFVCQGENTGKVNQDGSLTITSKQSYSGSHLPIPEKYQDYTYFEVHAKAWTGSGEEQKDSGLQVVFQDKDRKDIEVSYCAGWNQYTPRCTSTDKKVAKILVQTQAASADNPVTQTIYYIKAVK